MQNPGFDIDIAELDELMLLLASKAEEAVQKASHALKTQDIDLCGAVKTNDSIIDRLQLSIDDKVIEIIATRQPVASDLRKLLSVMKLASDFERAADYAVHLAKATKLFLNEPQWRQLEKIMQMADMGAAMIHGTAQAYKIRSSALARQTAQLDDQIDHIHKSLLQETLLFLRQYPEEAERATRIIILSGHLERLGDHMTNACEAIVFMVEGIHADLNE
ncbi:MAG: phosphate signaling complex protein PhoU [Spirochaetaceae bacterium]|nr:phosphate signaling complex protein PhoU [Spirochaetaceae bacterium]